MTTNTLVHTVPDWLTEGSRVAVITGSGAEQTYFERTVTRLTASELLLDGDLHFHLEDLSRHGGSRWHASSYIHALDSEEARRARGLRDLRSARARTQHALDDYAQQIRQGAHDAAMPDPESVVRELRRLHSASLAAAATLRDQA